MQHIHHPPYSDCPYSHIELRTCKHRQALVCQ
uniref:Uncharacterized protein n=1 Tax=Arundo donax TaxID=35708 RepID=A0A0A9A5E9_ARUDO